MNKILATLLLFGLMSGESFADIIFGLGNDPGANQQNVLFGSFQSGSLVTGVTNQSRQIVDFSSITDTLVSTAKGQANLTASDGLINDVTIRVPGGGAYTDLILNPFLGRAPAGTASVSVMTNDGAFLFQYPDGLGRGNNFLSVMATNGERILSTRVDAVGGFEDLRQVRIDGISAVPEPAAIMLLGGGLLGLAALLSRRARNS
jgi:hypothetical protein